MKSHVEGVILHGMLRVAHAYCDCKQQPHTEIELHKNINSNYQTFTSFLHLYQTTLPFHPCMNSQQKRCPILLPLRTYASREGLGGWSCCCCCCWFPSPMNDIRKVSINYYFQECSVRSGAALSRSRSFICNFYSIVPYSRSDWVLHRQGHPIRKAVEECIE